MEVIFYHSNCFDGVSAAALYVIGKELKEGEYKTIPISYFDDWQAQYTFILAACADIKVNRLTFLDYCPSVKTLQQLTIPVRIVDHHPIAYDAIAASESYINEETVMVVPEIEGTESGASLVYIGYKAKINELLPNIEGWVKHIRDNDLGIWEYDTDTRKFLTWLGTQPFEVDTYIQLMKEFNLEEALNAGAPIVEYQDALVGNQYATRETHEVNGVNVNFINAFGAFHTLLGRKINTEDPNSLAVIWYYADGNYRFRFNNGLKLNDISRKVAVSLEGGGHPRSSGARLSGDKSVMEMMNIIKLKVNEVTKGETNDIPISKTGKEIDQS